MKLTDLNAHERRVLFLLYDYAAEQMDFETLFKQITNNKKKHIETEWLRQALAGLIEKGWACEVKKGDDSDAGAADASADYAITDEGYKSILYDESEHRFL